MPFSKFEPHRAQPKGDGLAASNPVAARRARILKWVTRIVWVYTLVGFVLIAYWLAAS